MRKARKNELVAALRSGKYIQGRDRLTYKSSDPAKPQEYDCCLGVACKLYVAEHPDFFVSIELMENAGEFINVTNYQYEKVLLPSMVRKYFGIVTGSGVIDLTLVYPHLASLVGLTEIELTALNDSGATFDQIADVIEYFWEWL